MANNLDELFAPLKKVIDEAADSSVELLKKGKNLSAEEEERFRRIFWAYYANLAVKMPTPLNGMTGSSTMKASDG